MKKPVKIILIIIPFLILAMVGYYLLLKYYEPSGVIKFSDDNPISVSDFHATPDAEAETNARAQYLIFYRYECKGEHLTFTIYSYMDPSVSWIRDKSDETSFLGQQAWFMSYELYARKLRKTLLELEHPCRLSRSELQDIGDRNYEELEQFQDVMNEDVSAGDKPTRVRVWHTRLDSLLQVYQDYKMEKVE